MSLVAPLRPGYSLFLTASAAVTDQAATYDLPGMSLASLPGGIYFVVFSLATSIKNGAGSQFRIRVTDSNNVVLAMSNNYESVINADNTLQIAGSVIVAAPANTTLKLRAEAAGGINNYTVYDRSLVAIPCF